MKIYYNLRKLIRVQTKIHLKKKNIKEALMVSKGEINSEKADKILLKTFGK